MTFKRRVLSVFGKDQLLEIGRGLGLDINTRMTVAELRDALAGSKKAKLALLVTDALARDTLKEICRACGLDDTGKEKQPLVERILAAGGSGQPSNLDEDTADSGSAGDGSVGLGTLPGSDVAKETKGKRKTSKGAERRRAGVPESDAVVSGSLKAALRQFALAAAGGYRGHGAAVNFATHLLECFGWKDGRPEGATIPHALRIAEGGQLVDREVALWWRERRTMLAVVPHDAVLDFAWKDLLHACLQIDPPPQYVVLTNQRDLQLYDLARDREAARLSIHIEDLPKYSEAFPFFTTAWQPGQTPRIVNVEKVSAEVADLVAKLYRSVRAQHPTRERDVIRFTLQCITAMFAEDIGLLPKNYFTSLLYDGARHKNLDARLHELFVQMNTRDLPTPRVVPYFNGGLFTDAVSLPLGSEQVVALTKAAEANWTYVDPHIFGSVFQGIMDDAERHASGAHYTAHDDIMRVVGPTRPAATSAPQTVPASAAERPGKGGLDPVGTLAATVSPSDKDPVGTSGGGVSLSSRSRRRRPTFFGELCVRRQTSRTPRPWRSKTSIVVRFSMLRCFPMRPPVNPGGRRSGRLPASLPGVSRSGPKSAHRCFPISAR